MTALLVIFIGGFIVAGIPIAISMGLAAALVLLLSDVPLLVMPQRILTSSDSFSFLAIPLFIFAGSMMEVGGIARRLVALPNALIGHVRGSLAHVVVVSEIFFSGISGSSIADVAAVGGVLLPAMDKQGYTKPEAVSIVSAASAVGILVPPCILMVVIGEIAGLSVGKLFIAGIIPALAMGLVLMLYIFSRARRGHFPAGARASWSVRAQALKGSVVPLGMVVLIFGSILGGIATVTETAVLAVIYAFIVSVVVYREIKFAQIPRLLIESAMVSGAVMMLVGTGSAVSWLLATGGAAAQFSSLLQDIAPPPWIFLIVTDVLFIVLGATIEGTPAAIIMLPLLVPIAGELGVDPYHFAITVVAASGIGAFFPPIGVGFLVACSIVRMEASKLVRPMLPYLAVLLVGLLVVTLLPGLSLFLPDIFSV